MGTTPSVAAQVIITVIPIVGIVLGCTVIFFFLLWNYKQNKLLIEKGIYKPNRLNLSAFSLLSGLLLTGIGLVLTVFFFIMEGMTYNLLGGLIPLTVGVCLLAFYQVHKKSPDR